MIAANAFGTGWRLIFFVNLPLGLVAALGAVRLMPESRSPRKVELDLVGTVLAGLAMGLLIYPLIQGREAGWPAWTYVMLAASVVTFGALFGWIRFRGRHGRDPLIEPSIFRHRSYSAGLACIVVFFAGMIGTLLVVTLFLQIGERFSAIHAGLSLAPFALGTAVGAGLGAGVLAPRFGRGTLQVACVVLAGGTLWLHRVLSTHGLATTSLDLIGPELVFGIGMGMMVAPLFDFILASVTDTEVGSASGVLNAVQQLSGAIGVAAIGTVFFSALGHSGFVTAITRCVLIELATTPVLLALTTMLPKRAREDSAEGGASVAASAEPVTALSR